MKSILKTLLVAGVTHAVLWTGAVHAKSTPDNLEWPEVSDSYLRVGEFVEPRDVSRVIRTLPKREVRLLLNHPTFSEGFFDVREWDYVFNFLTGEGEKYVTCQYKILFNKDMRVSSTHWRNSQCAEYVKERTKPLVNVPIGLISFH